MGDAAPLLLILIVLIIGWAVWPSRYGSKSPNRGSDRAERIANENLEFLGKRWEMAESEEGREPKDRLFPKWFFEEVTERQVAKIADLGIPVNARRLSKGKASDLIGIYQPIEEYDREKLRFFKVPLKGLNQTRARHEVMLLMSDPENRERWKNRLATPDDKEFFKFVGLEVPKGLTHEKAVELIDDYFEEHEGDQRLIDWEAYESILADFDDSDFREMYEIKKVPKKLLKETLQELVANGERFSKLEEDEQIIIDALLEKRPDLERIVD